MIDLASYNTDSGLTQAAAWDSFFGLWEWWFRWFYDRAESWGHPPTLEGFCAWWPRVEAEAFAVVTRASALRVRDDLLEGRFRHSFN